MPVSKTAAQLREARAKIIRIAIICCALLFLYLPIVTLIIYSFNESRMVTVWTETSLKWYYALFENDAIIHAVGISLLVAVMTACASVVIGTLAAFVLVRVGRFRGESLFVLLITAPMVLPDVITGLALLLIFVTLGSEIPIFADRGVFAIWIAHVTFCSAYTTVVIRSRFRELDISIEEAAKDLGAGPIKVFFAVILPALMPSEVAAFLLAFTMSMDDLVIASFIAGPDSTTLPMLIFSSVRRGLSPEINALATIIIFIVSIFTFFAWLSMVKKQKRIKSDAAKAAKAAAIEQKMHYSAPHGDEDTFDGKNLSPEALAIFKAQAEALQQGQDTAAQATAQIQALLAARAAASAANAANAASAASATDTTTGLTGAAVAVSAGSAASTANAAAEAATGVSATGSVTTSSAVVNDNISKIRGAMLGDSAKAVTAKQREVSDTIAKAGMAKVVEADTKLSVPLSDDEEAEAKSATAPAATNANGPASVKATGAMVLEKAKGLGKVEATTQSSLQQAKAKKAAMQSAIDHALEQAQYEDEILPETGTNLGKGKRMSSLDEHGQSKTPKATTLSSLEQAKAKKQKAANDHSAIAATKLSAEQAKAETDKAKVVDTTK